MVLDKRRSTAAVGVIAAVALLAGAGGACGADASPTATPHAPATVSVVAAENQYGNVAAQIGGRFVTVVSIESNPNADPHSYEVSPRVASEVSGAAVVVQNGLGYDTFMDRIEAANPSKRRKVVDVQRLLGLPSTTGNPHLWYSPATMPATANALAADLADVDPAEAYYFRANLHRFLASLRPWKAAIAAFKARHRGVTAATCWRPWGSATSRRSGSRLP
jgi:zinc/manganese transport system substrate-binding protein